MASSAPRPASPRIDGVYELGHVLDVLNATTHDFGPADIERVERFWTSGDMHGSQAGFVLRLRDGRRAHVELVHWHAFEQDEDFRIDVAFLAPASEPPTSEMAEWSFDTAHLGRRLGASGS